MFVRVPGWAWVMKGRDPTNSDVSARVIYLFPFIVLIVVHSLSVLPCHALVVITENLSTYQP
jgi:hypothetical protein